MNKFTKAGIATAAAVALLMGGAGTLAYWNSTAALGAGTAITAGNLKVEPTGTGAWTGIADIANYRIVPGDTLTFTQQVTVTAQGDTLVAKLELAPDAIEAASGADADVALASLLTHSATIALNGTATNGTVGGTATSVTFDPSGSGVMTAVLDVTVTVTFPDGSADADNEAKLGSVSLDDFGVVLTQVVS